MKNKAEYPVVKKINFQTLQLLQISRKSGATRKGFLNVRQQKICISEMSERK